MKPCAPTGAGGVVAVINNERGVAIIIVLGMLLLLTILGTTMLASSTSDLKIAGNYRSTQEAFYNAEAALNFGESFTAIYAALAGQTTGATWPNGAGNKLDPTTFAVGGSSDKTGYNQISLPNASGASNTAFVKVELVGSGKLPAGTGTQEDAGLSPGNSLKVNNFAVTVIANGPGSTTSAVTLEAGVARLAQQ